MPSGELYQGMDQATLDAAYNNSKAVSNSADKVREWERLGESLRAGANAALDLAYGPKPKNRTDYFATKGENAPLFVFIHGGYWQRNSKETFSFVAAGPVANGINVAVIGYTLAPEATLTDIAAEVHAAIDDLHGRASALGFDAGRIFVGGWSAGGHLAALAADNPHTAGIMPISGIFELEPVSKTYINNAVQMTPDEIATLSPIRHIPDRAMPCMIYVGGAELPELRRQSADYCAALTARGRHAELTMPDGRDHFTVVDELARADGILAQGLSRLVAM